MLSFDNDEHYIVLKLNGEKKVMRPIEITSTQMRILREIRGKIKKREDVYFILKEQNFLRNAKALLILNEKRSVLMDHLGNTLRPLNIIDGVILAIDNRIPMYADKKIAFNEDVNDFFYEFPDDPEPGPGEDMLM